MYLNNKYSTILLEAHTVLKHWAKKVYMSKQNLENSSPLELFFCHTRKQMAILWYSESESRSVLSDSLRPQGLCSPWHSPGENSGVGSLPLLQGIFTTQASNPDLLYYRPILYQLSHKGSPRILEWVAMPSSSGSSQPRNRTGASCIAGEFFTNWTMREALWYRVSA